MKSFLRFNGVLEIFAGISMIFAGAQLQKLIDLDSAHLYLAGIYGAAAISIGLLSILVSNKTANKELLEVFLIASVVFHGGVAIISFLNLGIKIDTLPIAVLHSFMTVVFLYFYTKR